MSALRAARGFTRRERILKFEGCYHGHSDGMLVKAGSGLVDLRRALQRRRAQGLRRPHHGDLPGRPGGPGAGLRRTGPASWPRPSSSPSPPTTACWCRTGLPPAPAGAVHPARRGAHLRRGDQRLPGGPGRRRRAASASPRTWCTYGKIIGGGMPVGLYGGRKDIMGVISPDGPVYQAGTLSGNPVAMAAGLATLESSPPPSTGTWTKAAAWAAAFEAIPGLHCAPGGQPALAAVPGPASSAADRVESRGHRQVQPHCTGSCWSRASTCRRPGFEVAFLSAAHGEDELAHFEARRRPSWPNATPMNPFHERTCHDRTSHPRPQGRSPSHAPGLVHAPGRAVPARIPRRPGTRPPSSSCSTIRTWPRR